MKKAVMYGAGNIGRGFIGKVFSESGYRVCFVDVLAPVVEKLNTDKCYPVKVVSDTDTHEVMVKNVYAVNGMDADAVADEVASADVMATAVGVNVLHKIINPICAGLKKRKIQDSAPLNIIICENLMDADKYVRKLIEENMGHAHKAWLDKNLGLVEASIGRMVPVMTDAMREGNILKVWVEPYEVLPIDKAAIVGEMPGLNNLVPFTPFGFFIKRKLFIHNMGHAMCAYLGWQKGYSFIHACIADKAIKTQVSEAMNSVAQVLHAQYGVPLATLTDHVDDLLDRFGNRVLGDTVARVGRDPIRKLQANDRLVGAAGYCLSRGINADAVLAGITAALQYDNKEDESAVKMQASIAKLGISGFLITSCGVSEDSAVLKALHGRVADY